MPVGPDYDLDAMRKRVLEGECWRGLLALALPIHCSPVYVCMCVCVRVYVSVCATDPFNAPDLLMFVGFPSAKDPTFHERYAREHNQHCPLPPTPACLTPHAATTVPSFPNKSTCVVISEIEPRWFDAWRGYASGKRPADYKAVKQRFKDRIMARLLKLYPQLEGKVECVAGRGGTCGVRHVMHVLT